jgi:DNA-binding NtrC family response regulator
VILQDESLVLAELERPRSLERLGAAAADAPPDLPTSAPMRGPVDTATKADSPTPNGAEQPGTLPELARRAALMAEREAIQQALDRFRWNRRKAAQLLGVSYKTLLNKMKECGISAPNE